MATNQQTRVLIIEDEPGIALALYKALKQSAYHVDTAKTGASGLRKANSKPFDIILLDLGLPDMSGLVICKQLREDGITVPIIILTAENGVATKVSLFDAGANDYVTKPFSIDELKARIRACLREPHIEVNHEDLVVGELTLRADGRTVERCGLAVTLRRKEYAILEYLMKHPDTPVTRVSLLQYAWGGGEEGWTNTIDVHIKHLRDKVDRPFGESLIKTVHGVGYKLDTTSSVAKIS